MKKLMRIFFALMCGLAIAFVASAAQEKKKEEKPAAKKPAQAAQGAQQRRVPSSAAVLSGPRQREVASSRQMSHTVLPKLREALLPERAKQKAPIRLMRPLDNR